MEEAKTCASPRSAAAAAEAIHKPPALPKLDDDETLPDQELPKQDDAAAKTEALPEQELPKQDDAAAKTEALPEQELLDDADAAAKNEALPEQEDDAATATPDAPPDRDYPALDAPPPPKELKAGERKMHAFLAKLQASGALNATQEAQLAALEAKRAPPKPAAPHPPPSWGTNDRIREKPAHEPDAAGMQLRMLGFHDRPSGSPLEARTIPRPVQPTHAPPPRAPSQPLERRAAWRNAAPASPERIRAIAASSAPPATPERMSDDSWPGVRDVTPPKAPPTPSPKKRVSFSPHVEEWPGISEAAPRAMPKSDDGMRVVKSKRDHGAVSPETARANARRKREAQRKEAGENVFRGFENDDAPEEAPPPPEVRRRKPDVPKKKPVAKKKKAQDDGFIDYAGDLRERLLGVLSIVVMTCVWFVPAALYVLRTPHDFSLQRFHSLPPKPMKFEILRPARGRLSTSEILEWRFSEEMTRKTSAAKLDVEIWLDGSVVLGQEVAMPRAGKTEAGDLELSKFTYGMGHVKMGIHNVTVVVSSSEKPPRFARCQNTSLFLSTTVGEPSRAAVPEAAPEVALAEG